MYPTVTEIRPDAARPPQAVPPRAVRSRSQRDLVEDSLRRVPNRPTSRPGRPPRSPPRSIWDYFAVVADGPRDRRSPSAASPGRAGSPSCATVRARRGASCAKTERIAAGWRRRVGGRRGRSRRQVHAERPETIAACLAFASLGAIWSSCSPDFGARAIADRFGQVAPSARTRSSPAAPSARSSRPTASRRPSSPSWPTTASADDSHAAESARSRGRRPRLGPTPPR
jgi:hypothetical protein